MRALAALLFLVASCAPVLATIKVCNQFSHPVHLAFAYEAKDGWTSDGWLTIAPNACEIDTQHLDLTSFYYRAESDTYGDNKWSTWGNNREFSVKDGNFRLDHAEQKTPGGRLVKFNGPDSYIDPLTMVTLTFMPDLNVTFSVPNENAGLPPAAGGEASPSTPPRGARPRRQVPPSDTADLKLDSDFRPADQATATNRLPRAGAPLPRANSAVPCLPSSTRSRCRLFGHERSRQRLADYNKAIEISPDYARAYENSGKGYYARTITGARWPT